MNKPLKIILSVVGAAILITVSIIFFSGKRPDRALLSPQIPFDSSKNEFVERKKELMLKEYDSLFDVFGRETTIVHTYRGLAITLITLCFTIFFSVKSMVKKYVFKAGFFIILAFYLLEVAERSVMMNLIKDLRDLESIYQIPKTDSFNTAVMNYEFRDQRDEKRGLLNSNILKAAINPNTLWWNVFLFSIYFILIKTIPKSREALQARLKSIKKKSAS